MSMFRIELTPEQEARLIAAATTNRIAPETMARQFVIERLSGSIPEDVSISRAELHMGTATEKATEVSVSARYEAELIDEGGVLVLARLAVSVDDWDALIARERETRIDSLLHS